MVKAENAAKLGYYNKALDYYSKAERILRDSVDIQRYIGLTLLKKRDYENAIIALKKALAFDPDNQSIINNLGVCYLALEQHEEAEQYFEHSLSIDPAYQIAIYNLASLHFNNKNFAEALTYFNRYSWLEDKLLDAAQMHAATLIQLAQWEQATVLLKAIILQAPHAVPAYFRYAQTLSMISEYDEAMMALRKGIRLVDAKKALSWVSREEFDRLRSRDEFRTLVDDLAGLN